MAGVKGQKSGGFGGAKPKPQEKKRTVGITFRVTEEEKKRIDEARGDKSLADFVLECINK